MIAFSKHIELQRFNPVLGNFYQASQSETTKEWLIEFVSAHDQIMDTWIFADRSECKQAMEWLDHLYGVNFLPAQIINHNPKNVSDNENEHK